MIYMALSFLTCFPDGVWSGERLHAVECTFNEQVECSCVKCAFNDVAVQDALGKRESWQNWKSTKMIDEHGIHSILDFTHLRPLQKKAFHVAFRPFIAHAHPWYVVWRSTALSSTKISWSASYVPIRVAKSAHFSVLRSMAWWVNCIIQVLSNENMDPKSNSFSS